MGGGLIGVVVPLYLAECLPGQNRGKSAGIFQWLLTLDIGAAALIGIYFGHRVEEVALLGSPVALFAFKDHAWRQIFWMSLPPGILFTLGTCFVSESPRWLYTRGAQEKARRALERSRAPQDAVRELEQIRQAVTERERAGAAGVPRESLLQRGNVLPFVLACMVLSFNRSPASIPSSAPTRASSFRVVFRISGRTGTTSSLRWSTFWRPSSACFSSIVSAARRS